MREVITGDDIAIEYTLATVDADTLAETPIVVGPTADVKARFVSPDHLAAYSDEVTLDDNHTDSDWANGIVIVEMPAITSGAITDYGRASVQIMVDDGGRTTFTFDELYIVQGQTT